MAQPNPMSEVTRTLPNFIAFLRTFLQIHSQLDDLTYDLATITTYYRRRREEILNKTNSGPQHTQHIHFPDIDDLDLSDRGVPEASRDPNLVAKVEYTERNLAGFSVARLWELWKYKNMRGSTALRVLWREVKQIHDWSESRSFVQLDEEDEDDEDINETEEEIGDLETHHDPDFYRHLMNRITNNVQVHFTTAVCDVQNNRVLMFLLRYCFRILAIITLLWLILTMGLWIINLFKSSLQAQFMDIIFPKSFIDATISSLDSAADASEKLAHELVTALREGGHIVSAVAKDGITSIHELARGVAITISGLYATGLHGGGTNIISLPKDTESLEREQAIGPDLVEALNNVLNVNKVGIQLLPVLSLLTQTETSIMGAADIVSGSSLTYKNELSKAYIQLEKSLGEAIIVLREFNVENELVLSNSESYLDLLVYKLRGIGDSPRLSSLSTTWSVILQLIGQPIPEDQLPSARIRLAASEFLILLDQLQGEIARLIAMVKLGDEKIAAVQQSHRNLEAWRIRNDEKVIQEQLSLSSKSASVQSAGGLIFFGRKNSDEADNIRQRFLDAEKRQLLELRYAQKVGADGLLQAKSLLVDCQGALQRLSRKTRWLLETNQQFVSTEQRFFEREMEFLIGLVADVREAAKKLGSARDLNQNMWFGRFEKCRGLRKGEWEECFYHRSGKEIGMARK